MKHLLVGAAWVLFSSGCPLPSVGCLDDTGCPPDQTCDPTGQCRSRLGLPLVPSSELLREGVDGGISTDVPRKDMRPWANFRMADSSAVTCGTTPQCANGNYDCCAVRGPPLALVLDESGDPVVKDAVTGLEWTQINQRTGANPADNIMDLAAAESLCANLTYNGRSDWHLPTRLEALSVIDHFAARPIPDPFAKAADFPGSTTLIWTSSRVPSSTNAWCLDAFESGAMEVCATPSTLGAYCVRCQREDDCASVGSPATSTPQGLYEVDALTVRDTRTRLTWQRMASSNTASLYTWVQAFDSCDTLDLAGRNDWRMPTAKELMTILDETRAVSGNAEDGPIDTDYFQFGANAYPGSNYWTSTPARAADHVFTVGFGFNGLGIRAVDTRSMQTEVRCVRGPD